MEELITRAGLLSRGAQLGVLLGGAGATAGVFAGGAEAAAPSAGDIAYLQLLSGAELLASNFYTQAIGSGVADEEFLARLYRAYFNEQEHYNAIVGMFSGVGVTPPKSSTFSYPFGTHQYPGSSGVFATPLTIAQFAATLEAAILGAYLGAMSAIQIQGWVTGLAEIMACEAQHLSYFTTQAKGGAFSVSFPPALSFTDVLAALDAYATPPLSAVPAASSS